MGISIILPCLNEESGLNEVLPIIRRVSKINKLKSEIILVDNGSVDKSVEIAEKNRVKVIKEIRKGYGNAYLAGIKKARGDLIIMGDCDGTYDFNEIPHFLGELENYDLVIGNRFNSKMQEYSMPFLHKYIGNPIIRWFLKLNGIKTKEVCTGFIATKKQILRNMNLKQTGMEFSSEILVKSKNLKVKELDISYSPRLGKSKLRPLADGLRHILFLIKYKFF